jgi:1-deoxy-D-xylulose-5-phosphate synthase
VAAPRDENQLQHLLATGIECGRPFALRFPRGAATGCALDPDPKPIALGRGELLRDGADVALVAIGKAVGAALAAADQLAARGIRASVLDARFAKPLDVELLAEVGAATGYVVSIEDHVRAGGFGSAVLEALSERAPGVRVRRLGLPDHFVEHGDTDAQWRAAGIDAEGIAAAAERVLEEDRDA